MTAILVEPDLRQMKNLSRWPISWHLKLRAWLDFESRLESGIQTSDTWSVSHWFLSPKVFWVIQTQERLLSMKYLWIFIYEYYLWNITKSVTFMFVAALFTLVYKRKNMYVTYKTVWSICLGFHDKIPLTNWLTQRKFIFSPFCLDIQYQVSPDWVSGEGSIPGFQRATMA